MHRIYQSILINILVSFTAFSQEVEKNLQNQGILIDALKEEQIGNRQKAIDLFIKLKYAPETKGVSNYYLARIYREQGKHDEAMSAIDESIAAEPQNKWYLILKANLAEDYGQFQIIAEVYQKLSQLEPDNYTYYDNAALNYLKAEDFDKALIVLNASELHFGLLPPIGIKKSKILVLQKKSKKALSLLEECLIKYPGHLEIIEEIRTIALEENNTDILTKYGLKPKSADVDSQNQQAQQDLTNLINSNTVSLDEKIKSIIKTLTDYIKNSNTQGIQSLIPLTSELIKQYPESPKSYALMADLYFQMDDIVHACRYYTKTISLGTVPYSVWENLLNCIISLKHWNALYYYSNMCMEYYPAQSFPNYSQLLASLQLHKLDFSESDLKSLLIKAKNNPVRNTDALILAARLYKMNQMLVASDSAWQQALRSNYNELALLEYTLDQSVINGSISDATLATLVKSGQIHPATKFYKIAQIYFNRKDFAKARNYLEEALKFPVSKNKEMFQMAASIYEALGDTQQANLSLVTANEFSEERMEYPFMLQSKGK